MGILFTRRRLSPDEKAYRKYRKLTPELRELIARVARGEAKDAVQEVMETQGVAWNSNGTVRVVAASGACPMGSIGCPFVGTDHHHEPPTEMEQHL